MSKLTSGNVTITLAGEKVVLKPTPRAAMAISNHFSGLQGAVPRLAGHDIAAAVTVISNGAGIKGDAVKGLSEKVYRAGIADLAPSLVEFVVILMNGGKRPEGMDGDDETDDAEPEAGEGNAED